MNEDEVQRKRRQNEEENTQHRAEILGIPYLDTRDFERNSPLHINLLEKPFMHENHIIPLERGEGGTPFKFMVTSQTPRTVMSQMVKQYDDDGYRIEFYLISESAFRVFMLRYDPPLAVEYEDIEKWVTKNV